MPKRDVAKWFFEGALIVFSVLLALVISEVVDQRKTQEQTRVALERITLELQRNSGILASWQGRHAALGEQLGRLAEDRDSPLHDQLLASGFLNLGLVMEEESLIDATLSSSAWAAAQSTGLAAEIDYDTVQMLTAAYALQRILSDQTVTRITELYFERETHRREHLDGTITQFRLLLGELVSQEATLLYLYGEALGRLEGGKE